MAESTGTENMVTPENLSNKPLYGLEPPSAIIHTNNKAVGLEIQSSNESLLAERRTNEPRVAPENKKFPEPKSLQSENEDHQGITNDVEFGLGEVPVKDEEMEVGVGIKEEFKEDTNFNEYDIRNRQIEENSLVGKLKIKPMASLVETNPPNPPPAMHPFFAGFDDHIRSLIMNRQPQYGMNSPMMHRPVQFMYYDNSTNMNLKNMLNGQKMGPASVLRQPTHKPYVPINVPRPPRSQVPFRTSFSTQTPPMYMGDQSDVSATPSTSRQWLPQSRPPMQNVIQNNLPGHNFTSPKNYSAPHFPQANINSNPKLVSLNNFTAPNTENESSALQQNPSVLNLGPLHPHKVSTSSSTDDLENHSGENSVQIKTEVDLGIDSKEDLQATVNECNMGTHFLDTTDSRMQTDNDTTVKLETTDNNPPYPILTGDTVSPATEVEQRNPAYDLPAYSTKGCFLCKCCDFRCNRRKKMKEHFDTTHTVENHYKCFYCIKKLSPIIYFKSVHDLEHHVGKVHRGEKRWQCKYCTKTYKCQASYKAHREKTCSQSHPYACHMCTFTCVTEVALEKHLKHHENIQRTQECPFCHRFFKKFYMKQHLLTVHAPPEEKPYHCASCNYATGTQAALDNHHKRTGHDKQFKCEYCDYASRSDSIVKAHVRVVHEKEDPDKLICGIDGCQLKCVNARSLKVHRLTHTMSESELSICPAKECSMKFTSRQSLRHHINKTRHHKPFKCPDCSLRFLKDESLSRHIQSIHVKQLLKKLEAPRPQEPVHVKNVVDVYNYVESGGLVGTSSVENAQPEIYGEDDSVANFGCWLGISGFGDITDKPDSDIQAPSEATNVELESENEEVSQVNKMEADENEDEDYQNLVPITCLVELKQEEKEDDSNISPGKTDDGLLLHERDEESDITNDSEYQLVSPELSCLVECQQNATMDSSTETYSNFNESEQRETDSLPTNLVKIEVEESDDS